MEYNPWWITMLIYIYYICYNVWQSTADGYGNRKEYIVYISVNKVLYTFDY